MLRCAALFVIAAYVHIRLIPHDLRASPAELFAQPSSLAHFRLFVNSSIHFISAFPHPLSRSGRLISRILYFVKRDGSLILDIQTPSPYISAV
jgi:hypothetical protein